MRAALVCALSCLLAASTALADRVTLYHRSSIPADWTVGDRASPDATLRFHVALKQQNLDELDRMFWDVSDPNSVNYGKYLTGDEVRTLTAASAETMSAAKSFLAGCDCEDLKDALKCTATVGVLENLFQTKFHVMTHTSGKALVRHMGALSVPATLDGHVEFVTGLGAFPVPRRSHFKQMLGDDDGPPGGNFIVVPETVRDFYSLNGIRGSKSSTQGVGEFQGEPSYLETDFTTFQTNIGENITDPTIVGPFVTSNPSAESSLDIQYIGAIGEGNSNWFWTEVDWMYEFGQSFISTKARPSVFSMSYAWSELDQCDGSIDGSECTTLGVNAAGYVARCNTEFQKIGLLGVTLLSASGDSGAHGRTDEDCIFNPYMYPAFPASSPYVTAVGGTQIENGASTNAKSPVCKGTLQCATSGYEIVSSTATGSEITSGGGFSWYTARPNYQDKVVNKFLTNSSALPNNASYFNASGRAYPDVAALSHLYYIELQGQVGTVDGTSCATPVWGGIIGLLNAYRLVEKKPVIGFFNPLLYQIYNEVPSAFTDVVQGNNYCTEDGCLCSNGFQATPGWDATTGLGTPVYPKLLDAIKAIDARREARIAATHAGLAQEA